MRTQRPAELEDAIDVARQAVTATPDEHPHLASRLRLLAEALHTRFLNTGRRSDQDAAIQLIRRASLVTAAGPASRFLCARLWLALAAAAGDWPQAQRATAVIMPLLPQLASHDLGVDDRRFRLAELRGLGSVAAWACMRGGRAVGLDEVRQAWSLLEGTRGILLAQALETRDDLNLLGRDHPRQAERLLWLKQILNRQDPHDTNGLPAGAAGPGLDRTAAAAQWTELMEDVRSLPGFERFGLPPAPEQMHAIAGDGTLVAILVTLHGCGALLMNAETASFLPLPRLNERGAVTRTRQFLAAVNPSAARDLAPDPTGAGGGDVETVTADVLGWMWDAICSPVLEHLGHTSTVTDGQWPRVWWIPTGPLTLLPLHAAGHHHQPGMSVLDRAISSYTPTVRALLHARQRDTPAPAGTALIAGVNKVGYDTTLQTLAHAEREAGQVNDRMMAATLLLGHDATHHNVMNALQRARWAHFACHGFADQSTPGNSHLALHDRPLPVRDLAQLDLDGAYLAVLSACTTAVTARDTSDEPIHLASAFQLAGFAHTIATLWPISDAFAPTLTDHLYQRLTNGTPPADALHHTIRSLRANPHLRGSAHLWASHIHLGP